MVASALPTDLLLEPTDIIRCAGVCKPWRRGIIGNAASLRPRPKCFDPSLLLGVFHFGKYEARLCCMPSSFQSAFPSNGMGGCLGDYETTRSFIPCAADASFVDDRGLYIELLWLADRFIKDRE
jgi:hypothetical protein